MLSRSETNFPATDCVLNKNHFVLLKPLKKTSTTRKEMSTKRSTSRSSSSERSTIMTEDVAFNRLYNAGVFGDMSVQDAQNLFQSEAIGEFNGLKQDIASGEDVTGYFGQGFIEQMTNAVRAQEEVATQEEESVQEQERRESSMQILMDVEFFARYLRQLTSFVKKLEHEDFVGTLRDNVEQNCPESYKNRCMADLDILATKRSNNAFTVQLLVMGQNVIMFMREIDQKNHLSTHNVQLVPHQPSVAKIAKNETQVNRRAAKKKESEKIVPFSILCAGRMPNTSTLKGLIDSDDTNVIKRQQQRAVIVFSQFFWVKGATAVKRDSAVNKVNDYVTALKDIIRKAGFGKKSPGALEGRYTYQVPGEDRTATERILIGPNSVKSVDRYIHRFIENSTKNTVFAVTHRRIKEFVPLGEGPKGEVARRVLRVFIPAVSAWLATAFQPDFFQSIHERVVQDLVANQVAGSVKEAETLYTNARAVVAGVFNVGTASTFLEMGVAYDSTLQDALKVLIYSNAEDLVSAGAKKGEVMLTAPQSIRALLQTNVPYDYRGDVPELVQDGVSVIAQSTLAAQKTVLRKKKAFQPQESQIRRNASGQIMGISPDDFNLKNITTIVRLLAKPLTYRSDGELIDEIDDQNKFLLFKKKTAKGAPTDNFELNGIPIRDIRAMLASEATVVADYRRANTKTYTDAVQAAKSTK